MNRKRVFHSGNFCFIFLMLTILCLFSSPVSYAQIEMKQTGSHFQDFNSLSKTGSANTWVDNLTIPGWYWKCSNPDAPTTYYSDDGTDTYKGKRCYGTTNDSDRAIGGLCNSTYSKYNYGVKLYNSSSSSISELIVNYTGEQWKVSSDNSLQQIKFYYKITNDPTATFTSLITDGWTAVVNLNFISPKDGHSILKVLNGNDPANRNYICDTINGITIPSGSYILLRWYDQADSYDHGLAIDDVTVKWTVPAFASPNVWTGAISSDWFNSSNWSNASVPGTESNVQIAPVARGAVCNDNITIKNLQIVSGGQLTIEPGKTITVNESSIFEGQNCMILKSPLTLLGPSNDHAASASFLCNGAVSGLGSIKVERYISQYLTDTDGWHFLSSPVDRKTIDSQFLPGTYDDLYIYYEIGDTWLNQKVSGNNITYFENGLGYLISYSNNLVRTISGIPNNSDIKFTNLTFTGNRGWQLLGNPFPCGISWGGTDWGINGISGVAKLLNSGGTYSDLSSGETIPAMNGFFVKVNSGTNSITIPKSARLHSISDGWKQAKTSIGKKVKLVINSNTNNTFAETKIILNENATMGYDVNYDSPYLSGMYGTPLFYSVLSNGQELSTNCVPEAASLIFNFEFTPGLAKEYTLRAEISDDWIKTSSFILEDKLTKLKYSLVNGSSFKFNSDTIDSPDRFRLIIDIITGINNNESEENLRITSSDRNVKISIRDHHNTGYIYVYDLSGKQIFSRGFTKGEIDFNLPNSGFYLVQLFFNNRKVTKKLFTL